MKSIRYILCLLFFFVVATTYVYSQSWDMFFDKGKEHYDNGNYEKAIENLELYLKYETANPKAEAKQLLEQAKKRLAEKADTPTNAEQVAQTDITQLTEKPSSKVTEQPTQADKPHEEYFIETALGLNMKMIYVEGGTFMMGATNNDIAFSAEKPQHRVTLDSYYIAEFEVTQSQWEKVMRTTISQQREKAVSYLLYGQGSDYPMYYVSWNEAQSFCKKLSKITGKTYLLPTEAQWEFAARGGNKSKEYKYSGSNNVDEVAWYKDNSVRYAHPVGQKQANELGIYDMSGNVWEWCNDWYGEYSSSSQISPTGPKDGKYRVARGGGYLDFESAAWVYWRHKSQPGKFYRDMGFRVVCIPD